MSFYLLLKLVHIAAAIVAVGANLTYFFWLRRAGSDRDILLHTIDGIRRLERRIVNPAYIVMLLTGIGMVLNLGYPLTTLWIAAALALYVLIAVAGLAFFAPAIRRQRAEAERDPLSPAYRRAAARTSLLGTWVTLAVAVILVLMVFKPT